MTGLVSAVDWDENDRDRHGAASAVQRGRMPRTANHGTSMPAKRRVVWDTNVYTQKPSHRRGEALAKGDESRLQLDYDEEEKEEGELSDKEEGRQLQEQLWWKAKGQERGEKLTVVPLVFFRRKKWTEWQENGRRRGRRMKKWQEGSAGTSDIAR
mgnify:CR=1 FL=1